MFEEFADSPSTPPIDVLDTDVTQNIGRGRDAMILDMHTAAVLKDYADSDPRFRFEWAGYFNAGGIDPVTGALSLAQPLSALKPFSVPADLTGVGPDKLVRVTRLLDSY